MTRLIEVGRTYRPDTAYRDEHQPNPVEQVWINVDHIVSVQAATLGDYNHNGEFFTRLCAKITTTEGRTITVVETVAQLLTRITAAPL